MQGGGPGPVGVEVDDLGSCGAHVAGRGREQPGAQGLGPGDAPGVAQCQLLAPGDQVQREEHDLQPDRVGGGVGVGQPVGAGVLGVGDAVLAAGALPVSGLQCCDVLAGVVGGEAGDAVAVDIGQGQLGAGVGAFLAGDDPHPGWPVAQVQRRGDVGDPRTVAGAAVSIDRPNPCGALDGVDRGPQVGQEPGEPHRIRHVR